MPVSPNPIHTHKTSPNLFCLSGNISNSPLGHTQQIILLRALDKAGHAKPARLLLLALSVVGAHDVAHKRAVPGDLHFLRRGAEAADDGHFGELRGAGAGEGAGRGERGGAQGGAEEKRHCGVCFGGCGGRNWVFVDGRGGFVIVGMGFASRSCNPTD
jgi:hypothetical protein